MFPDLAGGDLRPRPVRGPQPAPRTEPAHRHDRRHRRATRHAGTRPARALPPAPPPRTGAASPPAGHRNMTADDVARWQAAKQLRAEHPKWLVIWVARTRRFHAYLLAASRAGAGLTDTEPAGLAAQMEQAERAATSRRARPGRAPAFTSHSQPNGETSHASPPGPRRRDQPGVPPAGRYGSAEPAAGGHPAAMDSAPPTWLPDASRSCTPTPRRPRHAAPSPGSPPPPAAS